MLKLLAPANPQELADRRRWFKKPAARKLALEKRVGFGVEIKGPLENVQNAPDIYWGLHLPDMLATDWYYHPEKRSKMFKELGRMAKLKPAYAVLHGVHLLWHPPKKESINRYLDHSSSEEYFKILEANIELINELKGYFDLKLENYPLYFYYTKGEEFLPYTTLLTGIGRLNDLVYLRKQTGVDIMLDIEHLEIALNFLLRRRNYQEIPLKKISDLTSQEEKLKDIFGFYLKKGIIPYLDREVTVEEMITKIGAKFYHVTGSHQDVIFGKKIMAHAPIKSDDVLFRKNLRLILAQKPETILVETSSSKIAGKTWSWLRPNETELSFETLCEILLEEL